LGCMTDMRIFRKVGLRRSLDSRSVIVGGETGEVGLGFWFCVNKEACGVWFGFLRVKCEVFLGRGDCRV
jgi:hypothetical protein